MHDILPFLSAHEGQPVAIAIVVETWGSSPRPVGSMMAVTPDGRIAGSVSGGCVEGAVIDTALRVIGSGQPEELEFKELSPEDVWAVGLSCGGRIKVLVILASDPAMAGAREFASSRRPFSLAINGLAVTLHPGVDSNGLFYPAPERLIVVGGVHIAVPLLAFARELGFETILIEPRASFADAARFPVPPDQVFAAWPGDVLGTAVEVDASTYAVLLTHDPKIDDQALQFLLRSEAAYVGCLGSRTTQAQRRERLTAEGYLAEEVGRIRGPVGLAIGAKTPAEIALSIVAEIVQLRRIG